MLIETALLEQLDAFARCGTLSAAAKELHLSQPALTRAMKRLEEELGVPLFDRSANRLTLNETGQLAAKRAGEVLDRDRALVEEVRAFDLERRTIRLAACAPAPLCLLRDLLNKLSPSRHITCGIQEEDTESCDLLSGRLDLAVFRAPAVDPLLVSAVCCKEQLCVLVPPGHPLAEKTSITFRDLSGVPMLQYKDAGFWVDLCRRKIPDARLILQEDRKTFLELASTSALPRFYTALFNKFEAQDVSGRRILPIEDPEASVTYHLAARREDMSRYLALFAKLPVQAQTS